MKTDQQLIYESAVHLRKGLVLPSSVSAMLSFVEKSIQENGNHSQSSSTKFFESTSQFQTAFNKLKKGEKIQHYCFCVQFFNSMTDDKNIKFQSKRFDRPQIHFVTYQSRGILGFSEKTMATIDNKNKKLILSSVGKKDETINLRNFLMRESKDTKKHCLILESVVKYESRTTLRLYFEQHVYHQTKINLKNLLDQIEKQKLYEELIRTMKPTNLGFSETSHSLSSPEYHFLNKQNLRTFNNLTETLLENQEDDESVERMEIFKCSYKTITTNGNIYYLQELLFLPKENVIDVLQMREHTWNTLCYESSVLESSEAETVFAVKLELNDVKYSTTFIESNRDDRIIMMSIKTDDVQNSHPLNFDFVYIKVMKITNQTTQLIVKARIETLDSNREEFVVQYLKQFSNIYEIADRSQSKSQLKKIIEHQNQTVYFDAQGEPDDIFLSEEQLDEIYDRTEDVKQAKYEISTNSQIESDTTAELQCLKYMHFMQARERAELKIAKEHYFDAEWVRNKNGGLKCINEKILNQQKKVAKHIISTVGRNLFTNIRGIMNISLPACICTKMSHLKMIATNFVYAPLLVETTLKLSPLERMKNIVAFLITVGNTGIASEKPFNPILGQTFQGLINGCPIYLEQISHHPPISSYLMEGRGYKIIGAVDPKVEPTGINSVRCYSKRQNKIVFDDGSTIFMNIPKIFMKGFIYGNRQFCFEGKNYIYDDKNNLYAEVYFGPNNSLFKSKGLLDVVFGKIFKVKPCFKEMFHNSTTKQFVLKDYVVQQLSQFQGTWTQSIRFDNKQFFNFRTQLPCILEEYSHPLPSDSQFRTDIQRLCENNMKQAESEKQRLENIQRNDKALRQKFNKSK